MHWSLSRLQDNFSLFATLQSSSRLFFSVLAACISPLVLTLILPSAWVFVWLGTCCWKMSWIKTSSGKKQ